MKKIKKVFIRRRGYYHQVFEQCLGESEEEAIARTLSSAIDKIPAKDVSIFSEEYPVDWIY